MRMNVKYKYLIVIKNVLILSGDFIVFVMRVFILVVLISVLKVYVFFLLIFLFYDFDKCKYYIYICFLRI